MEDRQHQVEIEATVTRKRGVVIAFLATLAERTIRDAFTGGGPSIRAAKKSA